MSRRTSRASGTSRTAIAFAPAAITNFFRIEFSEKGEPTGATGGGYVLSNGVISRATVSQRRTDRLRVAVNGDPEYDARTTSRAVRLLLSAVGDHTDVSLDQFVSVPIGAGFGASAASAVSGVYSVAAASSHWSSPSALAQHAHLAEVYEQTGLGTVSVVYSGTGAGAIVRPGIPGVAKFLNVRVPKRTRLVTATVGPYSKRRAFSSKTLMAKIDRWGRSSLESFLSDPTLETLGDEGERFSSGIGLETPELRKIIESAQKAGASHASQNMIGLAVHALADVDTAPKVVSAISRVSSARIDVFGIGSVRAGVLSVSRR